MEIYNKIYKALSITFFVIHVCVLLYVVIVGFLPYLDEKNFYQTWRNEYIIIALLVIGCICSYFVIKWPEFSVAVAIVDDIWVFIYWVKLGLVAIANGLSNGNNTIYHIGHDMMRYATLVVFLNFAFVIYAVITNFLRAFYGRKGEQTE